MSLHKLTAGDGYSYLTRQVAAHDVTERGHSGLADYYSERGESPGRWCGQGLIGLGLEAGAAVTEAQMRALFGEGRHPDRDALVADAPLAGSSKAEAERSTNLGLPFRVYSGSASAFQQLMAQRLVDYNHERGLPWGTAVPAEARATIRTAVANQSFRQAHDRDPLNDRELAGFIADASRPLTKAVAGFDLTFTPVKSVSALWALADRDLAHQIERAHHRAVATTLQYLEDQVLHTRRGRNGVQQVRTRGAITTVFVHRDSRSGDPNLHSHVALSNKVQDLETGRWLAVDGRVLHKAAVSLSEMYNSLIEAELRKHLRVRFADRPPSASPEPTLAPAKRRVREVVGLDPRILQAWSRRSSAIETRRRVLVSDFQAHHGRPPTPVEAIALSQQANLETRESKHAPRSEAEQRHAWRAEAVEVLGSEAAVTAMVSDAIGHPGASRRPSRRWVNATARRVVKRVEAERAVWQVWHLRAEAWRHARANDIAPDLMAKAVSRVVSRAVADHCEPLNDPDPLLQASTTPPALQRPGGVCVYVEHDSRLLTSRPVVEAERLLLRTAKRRGGATAPESVVHAAIARTRATDRPLNAPQAAFVHELSTSGRRLQLAIAPAGSGKTTALAVLSEAWRRSGGDVLGLAPSAVAAQQLRDAFTPASDTTGPAVVCETLSKYAWSLRPGNTAPEWLDQVSPRTLVLIDEAGMASTVELAKVVEHVVSRGGSVRLVGDDRQLAAVGSGGVIRDIAHETGAVPLTEVQRFTDPAEAAATLAIRDGDPTAIGFYADRGRILVGDLSTAAEQAFQAWLKDIDAGLTSLLVAPTRDVVRELNHRAQRHRCPDLPAAGTRVSMPLHDGTLVIAGDTVLTRRNDRRLRTSTTDWVKNGDRWTVREVDADGGLHLRDAVTKAHVLLPASYVAEHVELGYATTVHGAQGVTVDTAHAVLDGHEGRALLYVALTRGRKSNHLYLASTTAGDPHTVIHPDTAHPRTAAEILAGILATDRAASSATTTQRELNDPCKRLEKASLRYHDSLTFAAEQALGADWLERLTQHAVAAIPDLQDQPAWSTLRAHLALWSLDGDDALRLVTEAICLGPLGEARDAAAVLHARILSARGGLPPQDSAPLPWLPSIPSQLREDMDWGPYLSARACQVQDLATEVAALSRTWTIGTAPAWARPFLGADAQDVRRDLAVWRSARGIPDDDQRPTGPPDSGAPAEYQRRLRRAAATIHAAYPYRQRAWFSLMPQAVQADPWLPTLCRRLGGLERAQLPVADYLAEVLPGLPADPRAGRTGEHDLGPLPDVYPAAALWWRLVPRLGPTALANCGHADALDPPWLAELATILGDARLRQATQTPAWPALVASVDEACDQHGWTPGGILCAASPDDVNVPEQQRVDEVVEHLVLRIAALTSPPRHSQALTVTAAHDPAVQTEVARTSTPPGSAAAVPDARLLQVNELAWDFYRRCFPKSWAPAYVSERLRGETNGTTTIVGYAPPGPTSLVRYLTAQGVSLDEMLAAGLARERARCGDPERTEIIDVFRDRMMMPVRHSGPQGSECAGLESMPIAGFIGRRNPHRADDAFAGPKYLNTKTTEVFHKSQVLFGLAEGLPALSRGAIPVLVEGPMDALAVTQAGQGALVGLAPMGTALSAAQAHTIRRILAGRLDQLAVATDNDPAGWRAAQGAFWWLTAEDLDPGVVSLPPGTDPASLLHERGVEQLADLIKGRRPLADAMIEDRLHRCPDWTDPVLRAELVAGLSQVIAARPPSEWPESCRRLAPKLHISAHTLGRFVLDESIERDVNVRAWTHARLAQITSGDRKAAGIPSQSAAVRSTPTPVWASPEPAHRGVPRLL